MSPTSLPINLRPAIEDVIYASVLRLDALEFQAFLDLTTPTFQYRITAYSPEIRRDMTWLEHDRKALAGLFELLPKHHVDHGVWTRHAVLYQVTQVDQDTVQAVTSLAAYRTIVDIGDAHVESGTSQLFVVGRYHDRLRLHDGRYLLDDRTARLETRQLGLGSHMIV
jgi:methanesulfonate monooxygenase small subunit